MNQGGERLQACVLGREIGFEQPEDEQAVLMRCRSSQSPRLTVIRDAALPSLWWTVTIRLSTLIRSTEIILMPRSSDKSTRFVIGLKLNR